tara:strand:+ start:83 stop:541 length:459 start_codon:yes stop_codon:yes gene_type:complete
MNGTTFTDAQLDLMRKAAECLIPKKDSMPSASEIGAAEYIDANLQTSPKSRKLVLQGIQEIEIKSMTTGTEFKNLGFNERTMILKQIEESNPPFFAYILKQTCNAYYTHPNVLNLIGAPNRPPQPAGFELEQGDLSSLESVRARGAIWRDIG